MIIIPSHRAGGGIITGKKQLTHSLEQGRCCETIL